MVALIAERFHVLPSQAARELENDPTQLAIYCIELLSYAEMHSAAKNAKDEHSLDRWRGNDLMERVLGTMADLQKERSARRMAQMINED
jgi:hypothetical protein